MTKEILIFVLLLTAAMSFQYYKPLKINETSGQDLQGYQLMLSIDTSSLIKEEKMREDCRDLRFYDGEKELPYWIEKGCNTNNTIVWVKLNISANQEKEIRMLYDDNDSNSKSDPGKVFYFFDDFTGAVLNNSKWVNGRINTGAKDLDYSFGSDAYVSEGKLKLRKTISTTSSLADLRSSASINLENFIMEEKIKYPGGGYDWTLMSGIGETGNYIRVLFNEYCDYLGIARVISNKATSIKNNAIVRNEWVTVEYRARAGENTAVRIKGEDGRIIQDWTDTGMNSNDYNKFVWFSQGRGGAGGTHMEYGDIDYVRVRKYANSKPLYSIGDERLVNKNLLINKTIYSKIKSPIVLTLRNKKAYDITNIELKTSAGEADPYFIMSLKQGEEKNITLNLDNEEPKEEKVKISISYDQGSEEDEEKIILYKESLLSALERCRVAENSSNCTAIINKDFEFNTNSTVSFEYGFRNISNAVCFKGIEEIDTSVKDESVLINANANGSFSFQCEFKANAGGIKEKQRESFNVTLEKAVTRIPLVFENSFGFPITVDWTYEKEAPLTYAFNSTQGSFLLGSNNTTQYVYLESSSVVSFKKLKREQAENYSSVVNGYSYSQIPLLIRNEDSIDLNVSWNIQNDAGFENVSMTGSAVIPKHDELTVFGIEKNRALKGEVAKAKLINGSAEKQTLEVYLNITNNDSIPYSLIVFENNSLNATIEAGKTAEERVNVTNDFVNESYEILGSNESSEEKAVIKEVVKTELAKYNFTGNISIGNLSIEGWNCTQLKTAVSANGNDTVLTCYKKDWLNKENSTTKAVDDITGSKNITVKDLVEYESSSDYAIPLILKHKNATAKAVLVKGSNIVLFERTIPVKYEKRPTTLSFDYDNSMMIIVNSSEEVEGTKIIVNEDYSKAKAYACFDSCGEKSSWEEVTLDNGFVVSRVPVQIVLSYKKTQEANSSNQPINEDENTEGIKEEELKATNESTSELATKENFTNSSVNRSITGEAKLNTSGRDENNIPNLAGSENKTAGKAFVATANSISFLKPIVFSILLATVVGLLLYGLKQKKKKRARACESSAQA